MPSIETINKKGNTSSAVMAQNSEPNTSLNDFPTPPWATRALIQRLATDYPLDQMTCLEPACNRGHMSDVLKEDFLKVISSDIKDYGYNGGTVSNFLETEYEIDIVDWVITNPPFYAAAEFIKKAIPIARYGIAMIGRTALLEGQDRYTTLYSVSPPTKVLPFVERVPMFKGRLDAKKSTATSYSWFLWIKEDIGKAPTIEWITKCRKELTREGDYINRPTDGI